MFMKDVDDIVWMYVMCYVWCVYGVNNNAFKNKMVWSVKYVVYYWRWIHKGFIYLSLKRTQEQSFVGYYGMGS